MIAIFKRKPKVTTSISHFDSLISLGNTINGPISFVGALEIAGEVNGKVSLTRVGNKADIVVVSSTGKVSGDIIANSVIVNGTVEGNIKADSICLGPTANVIGNLTYIMLQVAPGATLSGMLTHTPTQEQTSNIIQLKPEQKLE